MKIHAASAGWTRAVAIIGLRLLHVIPRRAKHEPGIHDPPHFNIGTGYGSGPRPRRSGMTERLRPHRPAARLTPRGCWRPSRNKNDRLSGRTAWTDGNSWPARPPPQRARTGSAYAQDAYPTRADHADQSVSAGRRRRRGRPAVRRGAGADRQAAGGDRDQGRRRRPVGAQFAAAAKPDGYTLLMHIVSISGFAEVDKLFGRQPKFTRADFIPIARFTEGPMVLVVNDQTALQDAEGIGRRRQEAAERDRSSARPASTARCICRRRCSSRPPASRCATCRPTAAGRR